MRRLIHAQVAEIIGPIRQEILSGVRDQAQLARLETHLNSFPDLSLLSDDYAMAAKFFNLCRSKGIPGSNTDFLICAVGAITRTMGRVLPKKSVHAATWQKLISLLAAPCTGAEHAGGHKPCCMHLLPPHAQEGLNLTCDQQKQVADLEVETKAKLHKILTPEQVQQLKQMRPPPPKGGPGCGRPQTKPCHVT